MKIITLNTHSLVEKGYEKKLRQFADMVLAEQPDVFALQEVNQSVQAGCLAEEKLPGFVACPGIGRGLREDNHAARLAQILFAAAAPYYWTWVPAKLGYGKYDEGLAVFSRRPIVEIDSFLISGCSDYYNWKTRRILGVKADGFKGGWFYTVHMGWWDDLEEPFSRQWERLEEHVKAAKEEGPLWLMGDFNSPDSVAGQGYDLVKKGGWLDTYEMAKEKGSGATVEEEIDGWRDLPLEGGGKGGQQGCEAPHGGGKKATAMRIDYIWCSRPVPVARSLVVCDGRAYPKVSDHYGVMIVAEEDKSL